MSTSAKLNSLIIFLSIIIIAAYGVKTFFLDSGNPENPQDKIEVQIDYVLYDDNKLSATINYSKLFGTSKIIFDIKANSSDYAKGKDMEKTIKTYQNISSIKDWLNTINMLNIVRNQFNWMLDSTKEQIISAKFPSYNNISTIKTAYTQFPTSTVHFNINYHFRLVIEDDSSETLSLRQVEGRDYEDFVWEIVVKRPVNSTNYEVTLTRMPKT